MNLYLNWLRLDLNLRPWAYESPALTNWATEPFYILLKISNDFLFCKLIMQAALIILGVVKYTIILYNKCIRVTNSMVEYSAFNRIVLGSSPRWPNIIFIYKIKDTKISNVRIIKWEAIFKGKAFELLRNSAKRLFT